MKKIILLIGVMLFVTSHSFADELVNDLKGRQSQFIEELNELSVQESKIVKKINVSIDEYSKDRSLKALHQIIDDKSTMISVLRKEQDVFQSYIGYLEKKFSNITNKEFVPSGKDQNGVSL